MTGAGRKWLPLLCIVLAAMALPLAGCAVRGSIVEVSSRPASQLGDVDDETLAVVYAEFQTPQHWEELVRRGLVREANRAAVDRHQVLIGMTVDEVRASMGALVPINATTTARGDFTQWQAIRRCDSPTCKLFTLMVSKYVYTEGGIVVVVQD